MAAFAVTTLGANAAVIFTSATDGSATASVGTDLLQTALTSHTWPTASLINNGTTGTKDESSALNPANAANGGVHDFILDVGASPLGYDISQIDSFSGWTDSRAGQAYTISFSVVGDAGFTQITPGGTGNNAVSVAASDTSLVTHVFDDGAALLGTGVDVIRFSVGQNGDANVWREVDVIGSATVVVPEPSTTVLFSLAGLGIILRRRRA